MKTSAILLLGLLLVLGAGASAQTAPAASAPAGLADAARGPTPVMQTTTPPRLTNGVNDDRRLPRNHAQQPPVVPHRVDGYQIDRNFNKCLDCHARDKTAFSGATAVSATHYVDRSGKVLDRISTRRYFCQQCHVAQEPVAPLIGNRFRGLDAPDKRAGTP
jgi:nitrate reductase (cytochrome), electron transfer subunit